MDRIYQKYINEFLNKKIVLISGPRQCGKTTLSQIGHKLGEEWELCYLSKKGGLEIDFAIIIENKLKYAIEVKLSDTNLAKNFSPFLNELKNVEKIQLVKNIDEEKMYPNGVEIRKASTWLCNW